MTDSKIHVDDIVYKGKTVEATVPDTLDLAERAGLALNSLTQVVDPDHDYTAYLTCRLFTNPPVMILPDYSLSCDSKVVEELPVLRLMSGSNFNVGLDAKMMEALVNRVGEDGLYWMKHLVYPKREKPWPRQGPHLHPITDIDFVSPYGQSRLMRAMKWWQQMDDNPLWDDFQRRLAKGLGDMAVSIDDYSFYPDGMVGEAYSYPKGGWRLTRVPRAEASGQEGSMFMFCCGPIRALSEWYAMSGDEGALDTATRLVKFVLKPRYWEDVEHAQFRKGAHLHAHVTMLWALLEYAQSTGNEYLKDFVRFGYERVRSFGISRMGCFEWSTEVCAISDMTALAALLSNYGVGDYWDDVEGYIRNQLSEDQLINRELIEEVAGTGPKREVDAPQVISDRILDRSIGTFAVNASPTRIYTAWMICCANNGAEGLYYAWESILKHNDGNVQVNLLLNRMSPWLDVSSYLPYEGKVVLTNKSANKVSVRIPRWVREAELKASVNSNQITPQRFGRYIFIEQLKTGDVITLEFPMAVETQKYRIESSKRESKEYTCTFKGNTLIDIEPRDEIPELDRSPFSALDPALHPWWHPSTHGTIPIYLRDHFKTDKAPMKKVSRFVSDKTVVW